MKKTLLALALLLGTTGVFAQVGMRMSEQSLEKKAVNTIDRQTIKTKKNVNLQTKDEEGDVLCDFSDASVYTFGTTSAHTAPGWGWNLQADTNSILGPQGDFLNTGFLGIATDGWWIFDEYRSQAYSNPTWHNGFAYLDLLTMMDNSLTTATIDAYIQVSTPIAAYQTTGVDIYINQALQRFNSERYFIEWSNDPTFATYDSLEFNVRGLELNSNDFLYGVKRITLPNNTPNANAIGATPDQLTYVRLRYTCGGSAYGQPHSYFWFVDDITYKASPEHRVDVITNEYYAGAYHIIPEVIVPDTVVYVVEVENTGATDYNDAVLNNNFYSVVFAQDSTQEDVYTQVGTNISEPDTLRNTTIKTAEGVSGADTIWAARRNVQLAAYNATFPSSTPGNYAVASNITSSAMDTPLMLDDTLYYSVVSPDAGLNGSYRWAKDRNVLIERWGTFRYGMMNQNGQIYLTDEAAWNREGYEVCVAFNTTSTTEDLYLNGVEVVPALDSCMAGAQIQAKLRYFDWSAETWDDVVKEVVDAWDVPVESDVYELQASDLNNGLCTDPEYLDVIGANEFVSVYLPFRNSVELVPEATYYACYRMASNGRFMIAADDPDIGTFGPGSQNHTAMLIFVPGLPASAQYAWGGNIYAPSYVDGKTPLIHMVVGDASTRSLNEELTIASSLNVYPNPATNNATISYTLSKAGNVSVVVTDLMGRVVMNMEQGNQNAGVAYTLDLNTANLANGTYFYTLNVNGERQTKKFVVSK